MKSEVALRVTDAGEASDIVRCDATMNEERICSFLNSYVITCMYVLTQSCQSAAVLKSSAHREFPLLLCSPGGWDNAAVAGALPQAGWLCLSDESESVKCIRVAGAKPPSLDARQEVLFRTQGQKLLNCMGHVLMQASEQAVLN